MLFPFNDFSLIKVPLEKSHTVGVKEFPVRYELSSSSNESQDDVGDYLQHLAESNVFNKLQENHGALVINLGTTDPDLLSKYIEIIQVGSGKHTFIQSGVQAKRTEVAKYLQTANEGDPLRTIYQHNEFSRFKLYPNNLVFVNVKHTVPFGNGGETPILHVGELYNCLVNELPDFIEDLRSKGLYMTQDWPFERNKLGFTWVDKYSFGRDIVDVDDLVTQRKKAEVILRNDVSEDFEWLESNALRVHQHTRPIRNYQGKYNVLFSSLPTYYQQMKAKGNGEITIRYDNGDLIPTEYLDRCLELSNELEYLHDWKEGDIVFIDNRQVSHGRKGWKSGKRVVLVSMWDDKNKLDVS